MKLETMVKAVVAVAAVATAGTVIYSKVKANKEKEVEKVDENNEVNNVEETENTDENTSETPKKVILAATGLVVLGACLYFGNAMLRSREAKIHQDAAVKINDVLCDGYNKICSSIADDVGQEVK